MFKNSIKSKWKNICIVITIFILLGGITVVLDHYHIINVFSRNSKFTPVATPTTGGASVDATKGSGVPNPSSSSNSEPQPGDDKNPSAGGNPALLAPSGDFVSNHRPSLSTIQSSVCTTTPGAVCTITFIKDGVIKSLTGQATDRGGSTYWNSWSPSSIGLTVGSWKIKAISSQNGTQKESFDVLDLEVGND